MSRTDAHRPRWVYATDEPRLIREHHDHRNGVCELVDGDDPWARRRSGRERCYRELDWTVRSCSCESCSGRFWLRQDERRRRVAERLLARAAVFGAADEELDRLEGRILDRSHSW